MNEINKNYFFLFFGGLPRPLFFGGVETSTRENDDGGVMVMGGGVQMVGVAGPSRSRSRDPSDVELVDHPLLVFWILSLMGGGADSSGDLTRFLDSVDIIVGWNVVTKVESMVVVVAEGGGAEYKSK